MPPNAGVTQGVSRIRSWAAWSGLGRIYSYSACANWFSFPVIGELSECVRLLGFIVFFFGFGVLKNLVHPNSVMRLSTVLAMNDSRQIDRNADNQCFAKYTTLIVIRLSFGCSSTVVQQSFLMGLRNFFKSLEMFSGPAGQITEAARDTRCWPRRRMQMRL